MNSSAPAGLWDPHQPPFNHATPLPRPPAPPTTTTTSSASVTSTPGPPRRTRVTSAPPAKRITFYRSGDNQFGGIRMAIHGRSFKCFDALLDDLSQKVPLPFGVRTVTTPRGTRSIKHLEQLQDRACYLCSDRRQAKPVNMELAGKRPVLWQYQGRRPWAPAMAPPPPQGHAVLRQRRILLVKNSEPGLRRSTVLSRRNTRSLKAFLDEASQAMQFHVRKLYTAEGRKIDSVQSLMTCPSVLVCAGREAFSAVLLDCSRKNSEGKLPCLGARTPRNGARSPATQASSRSPPNAARSTPRGARSRASDGSEGRESKKSVNFGLETKKSVIHRRSDSSNHRFSVSSDTEKLGGVGCPMHHQARTAFGNDDIEKRVLVNKDGSLSVEMKVRFRLQNEETVQWSTQIRKSPPASLSSDPLKEDQPCYLEQGQSESCSDPDSASTSCDPGVADYIGQSLRHPLEDDHCPCCCQRCQQQHYDLWENPAHSHKHPVAPPMHASRHTHSSSSSSSCRSRRLVRRRTRLSDSGSERGRVVQEEVCVTEEVQRKVEQSGDSCLEVCRISRCSSRSEVHVEGDPCPHGRRSVEDSEERPPSAISNSSHVLQALQEDDDDEEEENLPPSASQCCPSGEPSLLPDAQMHFTPRPPSNGSVSSARPAEHSKTPQCEDGGCIKGNGADETDRATSSRSKTSRTSHRSTVVRTPNPEEEGAAADDEEEQRVLSSLSARSCSSSVCPDCGGCKRGSTPASCASQAGGSCSRASHRSHHSHHSHTATADPAVPNEEAECEASGASDDSDGSASSMRSNRSNLTRQECFSALSNIPEGRPSSTTSHASNRSKHSPTPSGEPPPAESAAPEEEERARSTTSAASHRSRRSHKSNCSDATAAPDAEASGRGTEGEQEGENVVERAASAVSAKSNASAKSAVSHKSNDDSSPRATTPAANPADVEADTNDIKDEVRPSSALSTKSAKSAKSAVSKVSRVSHKSCCSHCGKAVSPCPNGDDNAKAAEATGRDEEQKRELEEVMDGRAASAMSAKSNLSAKSSKSHKSSKALARSCSPTSEAADDSGERAASAMSARSTKSNVSVGSAKSCMVKEEVRDEAEEKSITATSRKSSHSGGVSLNGETGGEKEEGEEMEVEDKTDGVDENEERAASAISVKSARSNLSAKSSKSHKSTCKHTEIPTIETNGAEGGTDEVGETSDERAASAMSAKSKLSVESSRSHKSDNGGKQEGGEEKLEERSASAMSAKSMKSNVSAGKSVTSVVIPAEVPVIETTDADDEGMAEKERTPSSASTKTAPAVNAEPTGDGGSVRSKSVLSAASASARSPSPSKTPTSRSPTRHAQSTPEAAAAPSPGTPQTPKRQLLPGSEAGVRGSSALSVRSAASTRSNRSKCRCGSSSALQKTKKEEEEELENEATERAASVLSASLGIERPLSAGSGSVSLGLPEDRESIKSDGGRSESHTARSNLSAKSSKVKPVDIPTIETTGGNEEAMGGEMPTVERSASALSAKSNASAKSSRSHKSTSSYSKGQNVGTSPAKTGKSTNYLNTPDNRTPSVMSSSSNKVRIKTPTRASPKPTTPVPGDSAAEILSTVKPSDGKDDATDENALSVSKSPNCLRPQSAGALSSRSDKKAQPKESLRPKSAVATDDSNSNESGLSKSLSAADLLRETIAAGRPLSRQSKVSQKSGASRRSEKRQEEDLTPACLPNASLNEVVSDWLKNIPTNDGMLALGDELNGGGQQQGKEMEVEHGEQGEKEVEEDEVEKVEEEEEEAGDDVVEEEKSDAALPTADITSSHPASLSEGKDLLHKNCHSSVAVMKVLLGPTKGRCRSLPEVSPVYGRRLSTSAQGLLDCLTQLQLIEPGSVSDGEQPKDRDQRYFEIITLLQSLWLSKPKDKEAEHGQVSPPRSSSGVGMSSGSGGSGNNGIDAGDGTLLKATDNEAVSAHVADAGEGDTEAGDTGEEKATADEGTKGVEELTAELPELPTEPDGKEPSIPAERSPSPTCGEVMDSPKRSGAPSPAGKSSNGDTEQESPPGTTADLPSATLEAPLPKQPSQDPDPMWVLRLLKKLEKQFMNHYTDAMADFKVRWDLDDSLMLDTMIKELREEVSQRIQRSIGREVKKIQGRAGKAPRPPAEANLSRESTMTDRRRRMLKVMKNQSVKTGDSLSDDDTAGSYSDQRSDDDYCPCDACVRKKMAARPPKMHPAASAAPVMMAFDLRKILQAKKDPELPPAASAAPVTKAFDLRKILQAKKDPEAPPPPPALSPDPADGNAANGDVQEEGNTLEVVQEEEEEGDEEVPSVETIPEEEEEQEEEKEETPTEEVEEAEAEEKAGETGEEGEEEEEEEEEDDVEKVEEDGGEGAAEEQCECQHPHETEGEGGEEEDGEGEADEEESGDTSGPGDKTQGETSAEDGGEGTETGGEEEGRTSENDDGEQENVEGENEEEDEDEEEAAGEEQSEDAVENEEEESTPAEEFTEGNTGASAEAEDEDEGDDDDDEQEKGVTDEDESGGEAASTQTKELGGVPVVCVTEGEEADGEDSDTGSKRPSEAGADESGRDGTAGDEGEKEAAGEEEEESEDVVENIAEEFGEAKQQQVNGLSHQYTRTSVESQPGSLEAIDTEPSRTVSPLHPVKSQETGSKMVAGVSRGEGVAGKGQRRSRSPARVKRRKPKGSDVDLDDLEV